MLKMYFFVLSNPKIFRVVHLEVILDFQSIQCEFFLFKNILHSKSHFLLLSGSKK